MTDRQSLDGAVIAVTGLHRGESPQPGGAVLSSLRRAAPGIRAIGLCYDPLETGIYSEGLDRLDRAFMMPYPRAGSDALLARLNEILDVEPIDVLIPCLDSEIGNYIAIAQDLADRGVRLCLPSMRAFEDRDKSRLAEFCHSIDVPSPKTFEANDAATLSHYAAETGFPCYVKGRLYDARKVESVTQLQAAFLDIFNIWGAPVLLQEAASGEEYNIVGLGDGHGGIIGHVMLRKLLKTHIGKGFGGIVVDDAALLEKAERIIDKLRWNGPFELEFLKTRNRPHMLFEMNPRFPSWVDFAAQVGCNLPARMVEAMLDAPLSTVSPPPAGRMFLRHCADIVADISDVARIGTTGDSELSVDAIPVSEVVR